MSVLNPIPRGDYRRYYSDVVYTDGTKPDLKQGDYLFRITLKHCVKDQDSAAIAILTNTDGRITVDPVIINRLLWEIRPTDYTGYLATPISMPYVAYWDLQATGLNNMYPVTLDGGQFKIIPDVSTAYP